MNIITTRKNKPEFICHNALKSDVTNPFVSLYENVQMIVQTEKFKFDIKFSMDGTKLVKKVAEETGPDGNCLPQLPPEKLKKEYCGDDYNTVMVVTPDSLITCGTLRGGLCMRRDKESLNTTITTSSSSSNIRLVSSDKASAVGTFLKLRDRSFSGKFENIVLFAKQYTDLPLPLPKLKESAIFSVSPDLTEKVMGTSNFGNVFDLFLKTQGKVTMDYRVVIENENFVFLLVNQNSQSKLVKICKSIDSEDPKRVYEDIPISCNAGGTNLTHVKHGMFITISGKSYLVGLFSNSKPILSAMCVFEENEIYQAFLKSREHRYMCPKNDLSVEDMIFANDVKPKVCITKNESVSSDYFYDAFHKGDYCNNVTNKIPQFGIIVGLLPLQGNAVYSTQSHRGTVVGSSAINNLTTLYIGTVDGYVIQVFYDPVKNKSIELREIKVDKSEIRAVKNVNGETFFMSQNKIVKLLRETQCGQYSDNCQQCMNVRDANCGWCVTSNRCTSKMECASVSPDYWLPSVKNQCLSLEFKDHPSGYAYKLDDTTKPVTLSVTFVPPLESNENMTCRLGNTNRPIQQHIAPGWINCTIPEETSSGRTEMKPYQEGDIPLQILLNRNVIAEIKILFYRCSNFTSCGKCIEQERTDCYWCTEEATCNRAAGNCGNYKKAIYKPQTPVSDCPQILSQTVSIPFGRSRTLEFRGKNLSVPENFTYQCYIDGSGPFNGEKIRGTNNIRCSNIKTKKEGSNSVEIKYGPSGNVSLEVFDGVVALKAYKCESLSSYREDCSTCHFLNQSKGYECQWCQNTGCLDVDNNQCSQADTCGGPIVTKISPTDGPPEGGTEVTIEGFNFGIKSDVTVTIAGVQCKNVAFVDRKMRCITLSKSFASTEKSEESGQVVVMVDGMNSSEDIQFTYKVPKITDIKPKQGILSGGRTIHLSGTNLNIGNMKYAVELINVDKNKPQLPIGCTIIKGLPGRGDITCKPKMAVDVGKYKVNVTFDTNTEVDSSLQFEYLPDPVIKATEPAELKSISSGGTNFNVIGEGFTAIDSLTVGVEDSEERDSTCRILTLTKLECKYPRNRESEKRRKKRAASSNIVIYLDGFFHKFTSSVLYVDDPLFVAFNGNTTYNFDPSAEESITLVGKGLATVTKKQDYQVLVGSGECAITSLNETELICRPPNKEPSPRFNEEKLFIRVKVGNANQIVGVMEYATETQITIIIIVVLVVLLIGIVVFAVLMLRRNRVRNARKIEKFMTEMHELEQNTMRINQEEFAEMQLNITDIKRDLVSTGIPYHSYQSYTQYILFPKEVEAATIASLLEHSGFSSKNAEKAMDQFDKLMSNKYFVKSLIGTLEKQRKITLSDKAQFAANFSVIMMGKMRDFFEIVNCLLSTLVDSANKKQHKTLFNRFESISLRLLSHWLSVSLYPYLKEGGGSSLFMLYKSTQTVVEKRPVDEVTGEAKNTLSEDNFLREKIDCLTMKLEIDLNGNGNLYTCEVLDCDTINQVKSKCLYQIYKNKPASEMPSTDEVDLEWMAGKSGRLTLSNIDQTSERGDGMVRRNTLKHYHVLDNSRMALLYKFSPDVEHDDEDDTYVNQRSPSDVDITIPPNVQLIQSVSSTGSLENLRQWHLVKNIEEEDSHEKPSKLKDIGKTSHITNLMHTKLVLQDNIKEVFDSVLNHETVPLVVHYLFGVLENLANKNSVEPDTLLCWKSESYAMRVWATLLVRPEFLFDIQKARHVEPCLNVIKQVFIDCFHSTKISKDSSLQKLLFAQEVPHYQKKTEQFYKALGNKAAITDADFWSEMSRLSLLQQEHLKFSKSAALVKLYRFVNQYVEEIIEDLDAGDETSDLLFGSKLDDIVRLMETDS
uniref:Sema domain-containing protein n=1 Tax=Magallana gigas TaxID=29159 RepID=A0A8W8LTF4_MAGGI